MVATLTYQLGLGNKGDIAHLIPLGILVHLGVGEGPGLQYHLAASLALPGPAAGLVLPAAMDYY